MHELMVTQSILEIVLRHAEEAGADQVTDLFLVVGQLSSVVDDSVQFYWDYVSEGTVAEGARLHFRRIPAEMLCQTCQHRYSPDENLTCPVCNGNQISVVTGDEFYVEAIDIAQNEVGAAI